MKLRTVYPLLVALLVLGSTVACTDVGVNPKSSATAANIFTEDGSYRSYLAKLYGGLAVVGQSTAGETDIDAGVSDAGSQQYMRLYWELQELPTDEAVIAWQDQTIQNFNTMSWGAQDVFNEAMYSRIFFQVSQVNEFLRQSTTGNLESRDVNPSVMEKMPTWRAEARFLRALSYWHAIDLYGSVPLVTQEFPRGADPPKQASRQELYNFVRDELRAITDSEGEENLMPVGAAPHGRADKGAAYMLLAKLYQNAPVYIGENHSSDVISALENVLSGPYTLEEDYHDLFLADNHTANGLIFAIPQDGDNTQTFGGTTFLGHASVGGNIDPATLGWDFGWAGLRTTPATVNAFQSGDTRPVFENVGSGQFFRDGQTREIASLTEYSNGYAVPKFQNITSTGEPGSDVTFSDVDYPLFRLADAYLMYAEAVARGGGGNEGRAVTLVNNLRERAFGDASGNITADELTPRFVLDERSRELFWEAHRRTDLIRFGLFTTSDKLWSWKGGEQSGKAVSEDLRLYPIPSSELRTNPNMTQNPGY
jgi:hypothetical protein